MKTSMENLLSWVALFMTALYSLLASCRGEKCGHEELVRCARPLERISSNDLSLVVTKKEELNKLCPDLEAGMKCITRYTINCMKEKQREHFNSLYTGTNKAIMELCHDGPYQDEFLKHAPCMQKVKAEYEICYKAYQKGTVVMEKPSNRTVATQEDLKSLCCAFTEYLECSHRTVRSQCGDDTARFTKDFLDRMSSSLLKVSILHHPFIIFPISHEKYVPSINANCFICNYYIY
ncbi:hypothetical protein ACFW04_009587 [Cataglyphis niger]